MRSGRRRLPGWHRQVRQEGGQGTGKDQHMRGSAGEAGNIHQHRGGRCPGGSHPLCRRQAHFCRCRHDLGQVLAGGEGFRICGMGQ